jgi:Domain of Unknown Function (DUF928)
MTKRLLIPLLAGTACILPAQNPPAPAAPPATPPASAPDAPKPKRTLLKYAPPKEAGTGARVDGDGASRGEETVPELLLALTPKTGAATTTRAQPSLFCFQNRSVGKPFLVTITEPKKPYPFFVLFGSDLAAGIKRVDLADFNKTLVPGVEYEWNVLIRPDPANRSADLRASGRIKRVEPSAELTKKLKESPPSEHAAIYAEAGIWYDTLAALGDQLSANPNDPDLLAQRQSLFDQAGIDLTPKKRAPSR